MWLRLASLIILCSVGVSSLAQNESKVSEIAQLLDESKERSESSPNDGLDLAMKAKSLAQQEGLDSLLGPVHVVISLAYGYKADYTNSVAHSFEALRIAELYKDTTSLMDAYNNLGIDFLYQDEYETSAEYFQQLRQLAVEVKDSLRCAHALNNLGLVYGYQDMYTEELKLYYEAKEIFEAIGEREGFANTIQNIGTVYSATEDFVNANAYFRQALDIYYELDYQSAISQTLQSISENEMRMDRLNRAETFARDALEVALVNGLYQDVLYSYDLLRQISVAARQYDQAYNYLALHSNLKDSLFNLEKSEQINTLQTQYEAEKKEAQIKILTAENELNELRIKKEARERWIIISSALVIVILSVYALLISYKRYKLKNTLLSGEMDNLRLRIKGILEGNIENMGVSREAMNSKIAEPLSEREFEILRLALTDLANTEIAEKTFVSVNTVKYHLKNIYEKIGVSNRKEAMQFALRSTKS